MKRNWETCERQRDTNQTEIMKWVMIARLEAEGNKLETNINWFKNIEMYLTTHNI